jgi:hypothetical protein
MSGSTSGKLSGVRVDSDKLFSVTDFVGQHVGPMITVTEHAEMRCSRAVHKSWWTMLVEMSLSEALRSAKISPYRSIDCFRVYTQKARLKIIWS